MSLTTCLTDYIGISGCTPTTVPDSGIYLDRFLQGIELKMIDQIATEQQSDWTGVWADVQQRAINNLNRMYDKHSTRDTASNRCRNRLTSGKSPKPLSHCQIDSHNNVGSHWK